MAEDKVEGTHHCETANWPQFPLTLPTFLVDELSLEGYPAGVSGLWHDQLDVIKMAHGIAPLCSPVNTDLIKHSQCHARFVAAVGLPSISFVSWKFGTLVAKIENLRVFTLPQENTIVPEEAQV